MRKSIRVLAFVLAGGEGKRLAPLTRHTAKPAVPFHSHHRLIDFALSNLRNSGIHAIHVLLQYQPQSLLEHLSQAWPSRRDGLGGFLEPVVGGAGGADWYAGTADAVYRNRGRIVDFGPDVVAIFSSDHVYRMDIRQMIGFHLACAADATIAAMPVTVAAAHGFGVIEADEDGPIGGFAEKPAVPATMPGRPGFALASMGNYVFSADVLLDALEATHAAGGTDFGCDLLPSLVRSHRLLAYDFETNAVAGVQPGADLHYWRDVGTIDAYFSAQMDTQGPAPRFRLDDPAWPIGGAATPVGIDACEWPFRRSNDQPELSPSCELDRVIFRRDARVGEGASVSRCIVGDHVSIGARCRLRNTIVEADNHLPDGFQAGFDPGLDRDRWPVSDAGVVIIPRGSFPDTAEDAVCCKIDGLSQPILAIGANVLPEPHRAGRPECKLYECSLQSPFGT